MFIYSGLFYINKKEKKNTFIHIKKAFWKRIHNNNFCVYFIEK